MVPTVIVLVTDVEVSVTCELDMLCTTDDGTIMVFGPGTATKTGIEIGRTPGAETEMCARPLVTAITVPFELTVATAGLDETKLAPPWATAMDVVEPGARTIELSEITSTALAVGTGEALVGAAVGLAVCFESGFRSGGSP
jgi:hypothetical protein